MKRSLPVVKVSQGNEKKRKCLKVDAAELQAWVATAGAGVLIIYTDMGESVKQVVWGKLEDVTAETFNDMAEGAIEQLLEAGCEQWCAENDGDPEDWMETYADCFLVYVTELFWHGGSDVSTCGNADGFQEHFVFNSTRERVGMDEPGVYICKERPADHEE